LIWLLAMKHL